MELKDLGKRSALCSQYQTVLLTGVTTGVHIKADLEKREVRPVFGAKFSDALYFASLLCNV